MEGLLGEAVSRLEMGTDSVGKNKIDSILDLLKEDR